MCTSEYPFASETIWFNPRLRYLPVMITRLLLSLKKATVPNEQGWSLGDPTAHTYVGYAERRGRLFMGDGMRLETLASSDEGAQGGA